MNQVVSETGCVSLHQAHSTSPFETREVSANAVREYADTHR